MLNVNIRNLEDGVLLRCSGRLVAGEEVSLLRTTASAYLDAKNLILDLACVSAIDGAGLGVLAALQGAARSTGCRIQIQHPTARVRELLELTNLDTVIEISPSREFSEICEVLRTRQPQAMVTWAR
jgi:anti-anti-sigma factor